MVSRDDNWDSILNEQIQNAFKTKFEWGKNDCALWTASVVESYTGVDYGLPFRNCYADKRGAVNVLKPYNGLIAYLDSLFSRIDLKQCRRGDIVFFKKAIGVCCGEYSYFLQKRQGITPVKTLHCNIAWAIG